VSSLESSKEHSTIMAPQTNASPVENLDVVIIGAGISGINLGYRLQERNPDLKWTILEGRHEIGGTWSLFKYPGEDENSMPRAMESES
jgi:cation diffusion facilitator CzcD-associated flavoprotein CzcO